MRRGTNATHTFTLPEDSELQLVTGAYRVFITYMQGTQTVLDLTNEDPKVTVAEKSVTVALSQADTLEFRTGAPVKVQLRWVDANDDAWASNVMQFNVDDVLKAGVITKQVAETPGE